MENSREQSLSISITSSSHLSNGSTDNNNNNNNNNHNNNMSATPVGSEAGLNVDVLSLNKLSSSLEQMLGNYGSDFTDVDIVFDNSTIGVHRCILASRSKFFHERFRNDKGLVGKEGKWRYCMRELLPFGSIGHDAFMIFLSYVYTGKLKPSSIEICTCVDATCPHLACRPAVRLAVELMYASTIFQIPELASLFERQLVSLVPNAIVEEVIAITAVAFHCKLSAILAQCVDKVAQSNLATACIEKELPFEVAENIKQLRIKSQSQQENNASAVDQAREKGMKRILKALDSEDVELVQLLLTESDISLDEAHALHYAVAYCDPKTVTEVLNLGLADVNLRNSQGHTVIHVAARRKEPSIVVSLLNKGAKVSELTLDGKSAVNICKRLTRRKDYQIKREQGQEESKDRICIGILEREMLRDPFGGSASRSSHGVVEDNNMKLLYLEDRVAFARMFFPTEAKLAMQIAHAETTSEPFSVAASLMSSQYSRGNLGEVDLNETPLARNARIRSRIETLSRTVELGRRYFPHCSEALDRFMEDDLPDVVFLEKGTPDEQEMKRKRYLELKDEVNKAFNKDKEKLSRSGRSSSSSSKSSLKFRIGCKVRKL